MKTIKLSACCDLEVFEKSEDGLYICPKCEKECNFDVVCAECLGTGELGFMEQVYNNEPHMADTGSRKCPFCDGKIEEYE